MRARQWLQGRPEHVGIRSFVVRPELDLANPPLIVLPLRTYSLFVHHDATELRRLRP